MTTARAYLHSCCFFLLSLDCLAAASGPKAPQARAGIASITSHPQRHLGPAVNLLLQLQLTDKFKAFSNFNGAVPNAIGYIATSVVEDSVQEILRLN